MILQFLLNVRMVRSLNLKSSKMMNDTGEKVEHYCLVYNKDIDEDLCYDSLQCLHGFFKISSVKELDDLADADRARQLRRNCKYSQL